MNSADSKILTVSKLTQKIKLLLEENYPIVWITGETSNLRIPASGHAYFVLKDEKAQISAIIFKGQLNQLKFELKDGMSITAMGRLSVYEPRGTYQLILEYAEPQGFGALLIAFEQLKFKLTREGLFDPASKKPIPFLPQRVGLITSPTGAVIHDMLKIILTRFSTTCVEIYPVRVQGDSSETDIVRALSFANLRQTSDVLILARGGGSIEDFAAYNSEAVARAIFASQIPIISAIGHETDFTIADFVADQRAPTPTAAAQMAVPMKDDLRIQISDHSFRLEHAFRQAASRYRRDLFLLSRLLVHPAKKIQDMRLRVDDLTQRLSRAAELSAKELRARTNRQFNLLLRFSPNQQILHSIFHLEKLELHLRQTLNNQIARRRERFNSIANKLSMLNPTAILNKGYSMTRTIPLHTLVVSSADVSQGQPLEIVLAKGMLQVTVTEKS